MKAEILDGKKLSEEILLECKEEAKGLNLKLAVVSVGEDPASQSFLRQKRKSCEKTGIGFELFNLDSGIDSSALKEKVKEVAGREDVSGLIVQLPLPEAIEVQEILNLIPLEKDIDVLSEQGLAKFYHNSLPILPPTIAGIAHILQEYQIDITGKDVVVVGTGRLVGKPLVIWLLNKGATFSVVNELTKNIALFTQRADILISGAGKPGLINGDMVKDNTVVIDCGISEVNGGIKGDVDFESVSEKASYITPVPGGVGPMTVAMLISNLVKMNR